MKSWAQIFLSAILLSTWFAPIQASASFIPNPALLTKMFPSATGATKAYIQTSLSSPNTFRFVDATGKVITDLVTPAMKVEAMTKTMPSVVGKMLKDAGKFASGVAIRKFINFPKESMSFFISLGAVMTYDLLMKANQNPVAYEQLINSQMDPLGQFAFYAFMVANGIASEPFLNMIRNGKLNRRFAPFIVYGGMSIGMMASNIVHEVGHWPGLKKCAMDLFRVTDYKKCDEAMNHWIERGRGPGIFNEWTPGLISLVASTFISGLLQSGLMSGTAIMAKGSSRLIGITLSKTSGKLGSVILATGLQLGIMAIPGAGNVGLIYKGLKVVSPVAKLIGQLTIFNGVQFAIEEYVTEGYHNYEQGHELKKLDRELLYSLANIKTANWHSASAEHLNKKLELFGPAMKQWRQMNMNPVLMAQSNWEQKFGQLTSMYRTADNFYSHFVTQLWERKYGRYHISYANGDLTSILDRTFPLNGVLVAEAAGKGNDETTYLEAPDMIEDRQKVTLGIIANRYSSDFSLSKNDKIILSEILSGLKHEDVNTIGKTLDRLNCLIVAPFRKNCEYTKISAQLQQLLTALRKDLGDPKPIWNKGLGYLIAYNLTPSYKVEIDKAFFQKSWDFISTPTLTESLMVSMVAGPSLENNESSLISNFGFKDIFKAPRIIDPEKPFTPKKQTGAINASPSDIFNTGIYDFLNEGNINPQILNENPGSYRKWWKTYPETQYMKAWLEYEKLYQENIAALVKKLYADGSLTQSLNNGPVDNGLFKSYRQEARLYLMILGEIMKDNFVLSAGRPLPKEYFNENTALINTGKETEDETILSYLKLNRNLDLPSYLKLEKKNFLPKLDRGNGKNLTWQEHVMAGFDSVEAIFKKVKVQEIKIPSGEIKEMPVSTINPKELSHVSEATQKYLKEISEKLFSNSHLLNEGQAKVAQTCLAGLGNILNEMKTLAEVVDSASYVYRHDRDGYAQKRCNNKPAAQAVGSVKRVQQAAEGC